MTRVIVHAGFHKTGTSSLQTFLAENRAALAPWFDFHGVGDRLHASAVAARIYAKKPFPWRLRRFRMALRRDLAALPDAETIVLSREHYSGVMPGHRRWNGRLVQSFARAGVPLGRVMVAELRRRFGQDTRIEFLYTVREREAWIRSVYGHLLRSIHLTESFEDFRALFPDLIALADEAGRIGAKVKPDSLHVRALEVLRDDPAGPAAAVLDLAGVPGGVRAALPRAQRVNQGKNHELEEDLLRLNRTGKSKAELKRLKTRLFAETGGR